MVVSRNGSARVAQSAIPAARLIAASSNSAAGIRTPSSLSSRSARSSAQPTAARRLSRSACRRRRAAISSGIARPGLVEPFAGVLAQGLQQRVARGAVVGGLGHDERLRDQIRERVEHVEALDPVTRGDGGRGLDTERPGEHAETVEHGTVPVVEERVRPVDGRPERLVAFHRGAAAAGQEPKALVEEAGDLVGRHGDDARGGELDRQRDAIEAPAHLGDGAQFGRAGVEVGLDRDRTFDEEADGGAARQGCCVGAVGRDGERPQWDHLLALHREAFTTRGQDADVGAASDHALREHTGGVDEVLAVVQHHEQVLALEELHHALDRVDPWAQGQPEARRDHLHQRPGTVSGRELAEPGAVGVVGHHLGRHLEREPGLPDATDAGDGHDRGVVERGRDLGELGVPADERRRPQRQVAGERVE